jgi:hypothetical protein
MKTSLAAYDFWEVIQKLKAKISKNWANQMLPKMGSDPNLVTWNFKS